MSSSVVVRDPSKVEDAIWEAVTQAIEAGWTPERFKAEISTAWRDKLNEDAKRAQYVFK